MTRIVLIGPIKPFRGGISHSTTALCKNLAEKNDLLVLSFKSLYPPILYPGKFQKEKALAPKEFKSKFCLDAVNPLSWIKAVKKIREFKPDTVIFPWWTTFLTPCYWFIANRIKNKTKISVVLHNVLPHEGSFLHKPLTKAFLNQADRFVALSESNKNELEKMIPTAKVTVVTEPAYSIIMNFKKISAQKARKKLGIKEKKVLLFFGFVRPYKGLDYLIAAMPEVLKKHDCLLLVCGEFWSPVEKYKRQIKELGLTKKIRIENRYLPDKELSWYFNASNAVVLPYTEATNSALLQLAFGYNKPVITTFTGCNPELIKQGKSGLLVEAKNAKELASAINKFYDKKLESKFVKEMKKKKKIFKWNKEKEKLVTGEI